MKDGSRGSGKRRTRKKSLAAILKEALKDASRDDLCTIEGIDSATGKPFTMDFEELMNGIDTIQKAVERCNKDH